VETIPWQAKTAYDQYVQEGIPHGRWP